MEIEDKISYWLDRKRIELPIYKLTIHKTDDLLYENVRILHTEDEARDYFWGPTYFSTKFLRNGDLTEFSFEEILTFLQEQRETMSVAALLQLEI